MLLKLLRLAGRLPLSWLQCVGAAAGRLAHAASRRFSARLTANLRQSGLAATEADLAKLARRTAAETGKGVFELPAVWFRPPQEALSLIAGSVGWEHVAAARAAGQGVLLLTPHIGCFEIAGRYFASRLPLTVLYRPPKLAWLDPVMRAGRVGGNAKVAPTSIGGVRQLLKALKSGEAVGLLPDHVPGFGDGLWSPFFGRPAFTMTLAGRLQAATRCAVFMVFARRQPGGAGFVIEIDPIREALAGPDGARHLNAAVEAVIRRCPEQYLWSYNRYKTPAGAPPPETEGL